jgi:mRNA-degrading endonuclease RelE of RelBE toxin-antitoxin system
MAWTFELVEDAERDLSRLPKEIQKRFARTLTRMASDPFDANVKALKGDEWQGVFRRRIGDYRIFFTADRGKQKVFVLRILLRSEKTYR